MKRKFLAFLSVVSALCCIFGFAACSNKSTDKTDEFIRVTDGVFASAGYTSSLSDNKKTSAAAFATAVAADGRSADSGIDSELNGIYAAVKTDGNTNLLDDKKLNYIKGDTLYQGANLAGMFKSMASVLGDEVFSNVYDLTKLGMPDSVSKLVEGEYYTLYGVSREGSVITSAIQIDFKEYAAGKFLFKLVQYSKMNGVAELHLSYYDSDSVAFVSTLIGDIGTDFSSYDENYDRFSVSECTVAFFGSGEYISDRDRRTDIDEPILRFAKESLGFGNQTYQTLAGIGGGKSLSDADGNNIVSEMNQNRYVNPYLNSGDQPDDGEEPDDDRSVQPQGISVESEVTLEINESRSLNVTVYPSNAVYTLSWVSLNESVATVDGKGQVTGVSEGFAFIDVTTQNGHSDRCTVTVIRRKSDKPVEGITLSERSLDLLVGEEYDLTATVYPEDAVYDGIEWSSEAEEVAIVDSNGHITAIGEGGTNIVATVDGYIAMCSVTVREIDPIERVWIEPNSLELEVGERSTLNVYIEPSDLMGQYQVTWKSSNDEIVSVDGSGNVIGVSAGRASVMAYVGDDIAYCNIEVSSVQPQSIRFEETETAVEVGQSKTLSVIVEPANAVTKISWSSSAPETVSVSDNGLVTALKNGEATITATTANGYSADCRVSAVGFEFYEIFEGDRVVAYGVGRGTMTGSKITIPSQHNSKPVTHIAECGFLNCENIVSVVLPLGITEIGGGAFENCSNLTEIDIPQSVETIGENAFQGCGNLGAIDLANVKDIGEYAFQGCGSLKAIDLADGLVSIGQAAFMDCIGLTEITVPDSVMRIGAWAFGGCTNLAKLTLPFVGELRDLQNTDFDDFPFFFGGSLYNAADYVPESLHEVTVTGGAIADGAFADCKYLQTIILEGVRSIGYHAFAGCIGLTDMVIPESVEIIGQGAFANCNLSSLTVPFIGETKDGTANTHFGYIFGAYSANEHARYVTESLKEVTVTGGTRIEEQAFLGCPMTHIFLCETITEIGAQAFYYCNNLTDITIPNGVTSIGFEAFKECDKLTRMTVPFVGADPKTYSNSHFGYIFGAASAYDNADYVPESLHEVIVTGGTKIARSAFAYCANLQKISLPESVGTVEEWVFGNCSGLTEVTLPNGLKEISGYMFYKCASLEEITLPDGLMSIGDSAFSDSGLVGIAIPNGVTRIGSKAFAGCGKLVRMTVPFTGEEPNGYSNSHFGYIFGAASSAENANCVPESLHEVTVTSNAGIGTSAFAGCANLQKVSLLEKVLKIGERAFEKCSGLTEVAFPNGLEEISAHMFNECSSLGEITLPEGIKSVGKNAFGNCSSLTQVSLPNDLEAISEYMFYKCSSLKAITLPDGLKSIGDSAFMNTKLVSIAVPNSVISIGQEAFRQISELESVIIGDGAQSIGYRAFHNCMNLKSVVLGSGLTNIAMGAFEGCKLQKVFYKGTEADWSSKVGSGVRVEIAEISETIYYYSVGEPTQSGDYWHYATDGVTPVIWETKNSL